MRQQVLHGLRGRRLAPRPRPKLALRSVAAPVQQLLARGCRALDSNVCQQRLLQGGHHLGKEGAQAGHLAAAAGAAGRGGREVGLSEGRQEGLPAASGGETRLAD